MEKEKIINAYMKFMKQHITKSNFYDHCQKERWKFRFQWWLQSLIFRNVKYYYDKKQRCYCRKVCDVKGIIKRDDKWERGLIFQPYMNLLVNYKQGVNIYWHND